MAFNIVKTVVDGVTFVGCELTGTDQETAAIGVAEATILAAGTGTTAVASPTSSPSVGPSRAGIDYVPRGRMARCAVCGYVYHIREMIVATGQRAGAGSRVCRDCWDQVIPIRGRTGQLPRRRHASHGAF